MGQDRRGSLDEARACVTRISARRLVWRRTSLDVLAVASLLALGACGKGSPTAPDGTPPPAGVADIFASRAAFDAATSRVGSAQGTGFSGTYAVTFRNVRFSSDCTVAFVREQDFYVDTGAPDGEIQRILAQGYPDFPVTTVITQTGGRIVLDADGDGVERELAGSLDVDGPFEAVTGTYDSTRRFAVARHAGRITGSRIEGTFAAQVKLLDDPRVSGSCRFDALFDGERR